jgi:hypothetical protein
MSQLWLDARRAGSSSDLTEYVHCLYVQVASFLMMSIGSALGSGILAGARQLSLQYAESQNRSVDIDESLEQQETSGMLSMYQ